MKRISSLTELPMSADTRKLNPGLVMGHAAFYPNETIPEKLLNAVVKPDAWEKSLAPDKAKATGKGRVIVRIIRCGTKTLDKDNLYGGVKPLCDALRYAGLIPNDDPDAIELEVTQRKTARANVGTIIEIETTGENKT